MIAERWADLSSTAQLWIAILAAIQLVLAFSAWFDLARRPREEIAGRKSLWAVAILLNFIGPIAYFYWGRKGNELAHR
jgi:hypothetical protein